MVQQFELGRLLITANAQRELDSESVMVAIHRHEICDWGDLDEDDQRENELSLQQGTRILSAYADKRGKRFWILTEADRSATTVLLPEDC